jgi:hypothetical protein
MKEMQQQACEQLEQQIAPQRVQAQANQTSIMLIAAGLLLSIGFMGGWLSFLLFGDIAKACQVVVISKEALISAENVRIKNNSNANTTDNSVFFGRQAEALTRMEKIAKSFENKRTKVLFVSSSNGKVKNAVDISGIVHKELVRVLKPKAQGQLDDQGNIIEK